jgi:hypothetical protein
MNDSIVLRIHLNWFNSKFFISLIISWIPKPHFLISLWMFNRKFFWCLMNLSDFFSKSVDETLIQENLTIRILFISTVHTRCKFCHCNYEFSIIWKCIAWLQILTSLHILHVKILKKKYLIDRPFFSFHAVVSAVHNNLFAIF